MNKKILILSALSLGLVACQQTDRQAPPQQPKSHTEIGYDVSSERSGSNSTFDRSDTRTDSKTGGTLSTGKELTFSSDSSDRSTSDVNTGSKTSTDKSGTTTPTDRTKGELSFNQTGTASQTTPNQQANAADQSISQRIKQALMANNSISSALRNIQVSTDNGVVTLRGSVNSNFEKNAIGNIAQRIPGVKQVDNQLQVNQQQ